MNPTIQRDGTFSPVSLPIPSGSAQKVEIDSSRDELLEDLPAVFQFPVIATVQARFYEAGRHAALPFPEDDD